MKTVCAIAGLTIITTTLAFTSPAHADAVTEWNAVTLNCSQGPATPARRPGPPGLLDIALVQAAVHDAVQAVQRRFRPYYYSGPKQPVSGSAEAAAASAAYHMLASLYGAGDPCLAGVTNPAAAYPGDGGVQIGIAAAAALMPAYRAVVRLPTDPFIGGNAAGEWRPTPGTTQGVNTYMANLIPFAMERSRQFRPGPPPALTSALYLKDYNEVKAYGALNSTVRTGPQTELARFWSVNFIAQWFATVRGIADAHVPDVGDKARLLALVGFAAADSQISVYDTKYHYNFWRPITAIQNGESDGNPQTVGDAAWTPFLGTPAYPEYSSGANCGTAAVMTILQLYFRTDRFDFQVSSSAAGVTSPRTYTRFSDVMREVVDARVWQGIHFRFGDEVGRSQGRDIAFRTFFEELRPGQGKDDHHGKDAND